LIVIGQKANTCIDSTVRYAAELGYEVTLVKDAIASYQWEEMRATLEINLPNYATAILSAAEETLKNCLRSSDLTDLLSWL
jgi:nicotinamidase-related amidase